MAEARYVKRRPPDVKDKSTPSKPKQRCLALIFGSLGAALQLCLNLQRMADGLPLPEGAA